MLPVHCSWLLVIHLNVVDFEAFRKTQSWFRWAVWTLISHFMSDSSTCPADSASLLTSCFILRRWYFIWKVLLCEALASTAPALTFLLRPRKLTTSPLCLEIWTSCLGVISAGEDNSRSRLSSRSWEVSVSVLSWCRAVISRAHHWM